MYWQLLSYIAEREHWPGRTNTDWDYLSLSLSHSVSSDSQNLPSQLAPLWAALASQHWSCHISLFGNISTNSLLSAGTARALPTTNSLHLGWSPVSSTVLPSAVTSGPANNHIRECVVVLSVCQTDGSHHQHCHHWWGKYPGLLNEVTLQLQTSKPTQNLHHFISNSQTLISQVCPTFFACPV